MEPFGSNSEANSLEKLPASLMWILENALYWEETYMMAFAHCVIKC